MVAETFANYNSRDIFMKTYLITGGAGFIGTNLTERLIESAKIVCVDNFSDYYDPKIKENNIKKFLNHSEYSLYRADICDLEALDCICDETKPDCIINLAGRAGVRGMCPKEYVDTNITGLVNVLETAKKHNIKKVISASSSSVYGNSEEQFFKEDMKTDKPISIYASTKLAGENICHAYSYLFDLNIVCLRLFTVYGPLQRPDMAIHKFTKNIMEGKTVDVYGDGKTMRDYTYVEDIVEGIAKCIDYDTRFEIFNLGSGQAVELNYLLKLLADNIGKELNINHVSLPKADVKYTASDISKARLKLGYSPKTQIEAGIEKFVDWFKNERVCS